MKLGLSRLVGLPIAAVALSAGAILGLAGTASAATVPAENSSDVINHGAYSVQETITNNTDVDWTLNSQNTNGNFGGGHWQQRPQQILAAHSSEVVSGYTDDVISGEQFQICYTMPNGDYVQSVYSATADQDPEFVPDVTGVFTIDPSGHPAPPMDSGYQFTANPGSGQHTDDSFTVSPAI